MKKFEPQYRLIRVGMATKKERASRQQRKWIVDDGVGLGNRRLTFDDRQATQEPSKGVPRNRQGQGRSICQGQGKEEVGVELVFWWCCVIAILDLHVTTSGGFVEGTLAIRNVLL